MRGRCASRRRGRGRTESVRRGAVLLLPRTCRLQRLQDRQPCAGVGSAAPGRDVIFTYTLALPPGISSRNAANSQVSERVCPGSPVSAYVYLGPYREVRSLVVNASPEIESHIIKASSSHGITRQLQRVSHRTCTAASGIIRDELALGPSMRRALPSNLTPIVDSRRRNTELLCPPGAHGLDYMRDIWHSIHSSHLT